MAETFEGGCACGNLRYRLSSAPMFVNCCHCRDCQRQTGSAFVINAVIETDRIALLSGAMFSLIWGIIKAGESWGWGDGRTWAWLGLAILLFVAFGLWETRVKEPLVPLGMFRSVPLTAGVVLMMLALQVRQDFRPLIIGHCGHAFDELCPACQEVDLGRVIPGDAL